MYVAVYLDNKLSHELANKACKYISEITRNELGKNWKSTMDAIKGTWPVIDFNKQMDLEITNQAQLVRAPEFEDIAEMENIVKSTGFISFSDFCSRFDVDLNRIDEKSYSKITHKLPSSLPPDTHANFVGAFDFQVLRLVKKHNKINKRDKIYTL